MSISYIHGGEEMEGYIFSRGHVFALFGTTQGQHPNRCCSELHPGAVNSYLPWPISLLATEQVDGSRGENGQTVPYS